MAYTLANGKVLSIDVRALEKVAVAICDGNSIGSDAQLNTKVNALSQTQLNNVLKQFLIGIFQISDSK